MNPRAKIVIPVYKAQLSDTENQSFTQCLKVFKDHPIVLAQPEGLDTSLLRARGHMDVELFPPEFFKDVHGYNRLMLSSQFYERFANSEYILLHQLDAFAFRDELDAWCAKGHDYIGAPWLSPDGFLRKLSRRLNPLPPRPRSVLLNRTGNGGFSLRKTSSFLEITRNHTEAIRAYLQADVHSVHYHEDVFWSVEGPRLHDGFLIPDYREAIAFAMDRRPRHALRLNRGELPFGCHGFTRSSTARFWAPHIERALSMH